MSVNSIGIGTSELWGFLRFNDKNKDGVINKDYKVGCAGKISEGYIEGADENRDGRITETESWRYVAGMRLASILTMREVFVAGLANEDAEVRRTAAGELCQIMIGEKLDRLFEQKKAKGPDVTADYYIEFEETMKLLLRLSDLGLKPEIREKLVEYADLLEQAVVGHLKTGGLTERVDFWRLDEINHLAVILGDNRRLERVWNYAGSFDSFDCQVLRVRTANWKSLKAGVTGEVALFDEAIEMYEEALSLDPSSVGAVSGGYTSIIFTMVGLAVQKGSFELTTRAGKLVDDCVSRGIFSDKKYGDWMRVNVMRAEVEIARKTGDSNRLDDILTEVGTLSFDSYSDVALADFSQLYSKIAEAKLELGASREDVVALLDKAREYAGIDEPIYDSLGIYSELGFTLDWIATARAGAAERLLIATLKTGIRFEDAGMVKLGLEGLAQGGYLYGYAEAVAILSTGGEQLLDEGQTSLSLAYEVVMAVDSSNQSFINSVRSLGGESWLSAIAKQIMQFETDPTVQAELFATLDDQLVDLRDSFHDYNDRSYGQFGDTYTDIEILRMQLAMAQIEMGSNLDVAAAGLGTYIDRVGGDRLQGLAPSLERGKNYSAWQATAYMLGAYSRGEQMVGPVYMGMD